MATPSSSTSGASRKTPCRSRRDRSTPPSTSWRGAAGSRRSGRSRTRASAPGTTASPRTVASASRCSSRAGRRSRCPWPGCCGPPSRGRHDHVAASPPPAAPALPPAPAGEGARRGDPIPSRQRDRGANRGRDAPRGGPCRRPARLRQRDAHPRVDPRDLGLGSCRAFSPGHPFRDTWDAEGQGLDARGAGLARTGHRRQHRALQRRRRNALQDAAGGRPPTVSYACAGPATTARPGP